MKTLTSPLSKFAANLGSALDPRKYGSKVLMNKKKYFKKISCKSNSETIVSHFLFFYFADGRKRGAIWPFGKGKIARKMGGKQLQNEINSIISDVYFDLNSVIQIRLSIAMSTKFFRHIYLLYFSSICHSNFGQFKKTYLKLDSILIHFLWV